MTALWALVLAMLRMNLRNRIALVHGFAFPLLFLMGFWALYRNDPAPLALHAGQFLTVTILGAAAFGLPTQMVAEREAGIWRRFRLAPVPTWVFVVAMLFVRLTLLMLAVALQLGLARALGMPWPVDPAGLVLALLVASLAFLGLGAVIAMIVPDVPAVQALGQCLFLYWVAMHPDAGNTDAIAALERLRLPATQGTVRPVRERIMIYAMKLLGRRIGAPTPAGPARVEAGRN